MTDNIYEYKEWAFTFKPGLVNGNRKWFVQVWLKDATFCTVEQGWFDHYAYRFKFKDWKDIPYPLYDTINRTFILYFSPDKKDIRKELNV